MLADELRFLDLRCLLTCTKVLALLVLKRCSACSLLQVLEASRGALFFKYLKQVEETRVEQELHANDVLACFIFRQTALTFRREHLPQFLSLIAGRRQREGGGQCGRDVLDTEVLGKGEGDTDTVFLWLRYVMLGRRFHLEPNRLAEVQDENIDFLEVNIDPLNTSAISASGFSSRRASDAHSSSTSTSVSFHNLNLRFSTALSLHKEGAQVVLEAGGGRWGSGL